MRHFTWLALVLAPTIANAQFASFEDLKATVGNQVRSGIIQVEQPTFDWEGTRMIYSIPRQPLGCVQGESMLGDVIAELLAVEAIHKYRCPASARAKAFWHSVIPSVEIHIQEMFRLSQFQHPSDPDRDQFNLLVSKISNVYHSQLDQLARQQGKNGAENGGMGKAVPCAARSLTISYPPGGAVKYMPNGYYLVWLIAERPQGNASTVMPLDHAKWTDALNGGNIVIAGRTRFAYSHGNNRWDATVNEPSDRVHTLQATPQRGFTWIGN